ncbi:unnamed protein product [Rotaria magnacalcarata]|nr:unnamed protein product [Rotaria magnacalcarata]CAF2123578.1 unnamed protein product [Rotaria magnacalcarata]
MKVKRFILDFEAAQRNSIERHFVGAEIIGCWFHFSQCLYRNIGQLGLIPSYKDDAAIRTWLRSFMTLPLVDNNILPYAIEYLQRHIPTGYNNRVGNRFGNRPNIWLFLYRLLIKEQIIEQHVQQLVVGKIQMNGSVRAPENDTISRSISNLNKKYIDGDLDIEKYLKACTFLIGNADVSSANANKMVSSTVATVCPTTTPPKKKKPAAKR